MARDFLGELYSLRHAADAISQRYFDGHLVLFPSSAGELTKLVECLENLVKGYNEDFAHEPGHETCHAPEDLEAADLPNSIGIAALEEAVARGARQHTAFLVDMAKAEALDAMGESQMALQLIDWHV
jgi:hypothetical protein